MIGKLLQAGLGLSALITIAAGSVMKEPSSGPNTRMLTHQANGVPPPSAARRPCETAVIARSRAAATPKPRAAWQGRVF